MGSGNLDVLTKMTLLLTLLNHPLLPAWNHVPFTTCNNLTITGNFDSLEISQTIPRDNSVKQPVKRKNVKNPETLTENSNENLVSQLSFTSCKIILRFTGFSRERFPPKRSLGNVQQKGKKKRAKKI